MFVKAEFNEKDNNKENMELGHRVGQVLCYSAQFVL